MSMISHKLTIKKNSIPKLGALWEEGAGYVLYREANETITDAKDHYVPVVTGELKASGFVDLPVTVGSKVTVKMGFGKAGSVAESYAKIVHEAPPSWGQGKNKYLERPVLKRKTGIDSRLTKMFKDWLSGRIP